MTNYKAILFDLGKVLIPFDFKLGYQKMAELGSCAAEEIPRRLAGTGLMHRFESGLMEPREFALRIGESIDAEMPYERFCEIWCSIFLKDTLVPEALVEGLKRRYRLYIVSNTNAIHFGMVERDYPILGHFDGYVLSHEVHAMKPAPEFYAHALARASCLPEECLFIDDLAENVEGARRAGMDAIQFQGLALLEAELRSRAIEWRD